MRLPAFWRGLFAALLVLGAVASPTEAQEARNVYILQIDGLACPFCAYGIEKQLTATEGVESVETDIKSGTVSVTLQKGAAFDEETARKAVEAAGFTLRGFEPRGTNE